MENCLLLKHSEENPRNSEGSFVLLNDGRIFYAYTRYAGDGWKDHCAADIYAVISADDGKSWEKPELVISNRTQNVMSVSLLRLQNGNIALVYLCKKRIADSEFIDCRPMICISTDEAKTWSSPIDIVGTPSIYLVVHNDRLIQLANGRLILPASYHRYVQNNQYAAGIGLFFISDDNGLSWRQSVNCCYPPEYLAAGLMEPGIIELKDKRLYCWFRTAGGCQYKSYSHDCGENWTAPVPASEFPSPSSPLSMKRDPYSQNLAAVWNDWHPERSVAFVQGSNGRSPLVLARSCDEGKTWIDHIVLENALDHGFAYTAMLFAKNKLFLGYCCGGQPDCQSMLQDCCIKSIDCKK